MPQREGQVDNVSSDSGRAYLIAYGLRLKKQVAAAAEKPARSSGWIGKQRVSPTTACEGLDGSR